MTFIRAGMVAFMIATGGAGAVQAQSGLPEAASGATVERAYDDVRFDLESAIVNRGLVIDYVSHIGDMLARTGGDVGSGTAIFTKAESMLFCSARLSRAAMEAAPGNIAFCPYAVFLYETPGEPGKVTVGFRRLSEIGSEASKKALGEVNALLAEIVAEATGE
ncbi:DUF302 domain-containing protein [Stappia sp. ES.058]|uniref:DUF302 domain-containing protein n=1 Tax=Stappia sp. ES.058 TaxID=1881061 RepID=UPI000B88077F|nr:DUF302 domain-containing protein [Stappia sp. ES.058]